MRITKLILLVTVLVYLTPAAHSADLLKLWQNEGGTVKRQTNETVQIPAFKPSEGSTTITLSMWFSPELANGKSLSVDMKNILDWAAKQEKESLALKVKSFSKMKGNGKIIESDLKFSCSISPQGKISDIKDIESSAGGRWEFAIGKALSAERKKDAAGWVNFIIPQFAEESYQYGELIATQLIDLSNIVKDLGVFKSIFVCKGLSIYENRPVLKIEYDDNIKKGLWTIENKGFNLYDANARYIVSGKGETVLKHKSEMAYRVEMSVATVTN